MERVIGWVDADGGQGWQASPGSCGGREGLRLRPTGMVVFATLETTVPDASLTPRASIPAWALRQPPAVGGRGGRSPRAETPALTQQWRYRASRGVAWLLGR
jgi:hypothetical protein